MALANAIYVSLRGDVNREGDEVAPQKNDAHLLDAVHAATTQVFLDVASERAQTSV